LEYIANSRGGFRQALANSLAPWKGKVKKFGVFVASFLAKPPDLVSYGGDVWEIKPFQLGFFAAGEAQGYATVLDTADPFPNLPPTNWFRGRRPSEGGPFAYSPGIAGSSSLLPVSINRAGIGIIDVQNLPVVVVNLGQGAVLYTDEPALIQRFLKRFLAKQVISTLVPSSVFTAANTLSTVADIAQFVENFTGSIAEIIKIGVQYGIISTSVQTSNLSGGTQPDARANYVALAGVSALQTRTPYRGQGYSVAVIDSGVDYSNANLAGHVIPGPDFGDDSGNPVDFLGHGTQVADVLLGDGSKLPGVIPDSNVIDLKVTSGDSPVASSGAILRALQWVIDNHTRFNITAIDISLGNGVTAKGIGDATLDPLFRQLNQMGIFIAAGAGNAYAPGSLPGLSTIAASPYVAAVGAVWAGDVGQATFPSGAVQHTTGPDVIVADSQRGPGLDLLAPAPIFSGEASDDSALRTGTSLATPVVAGAAVLVREVADQLGIAITPSQILALLQQTGTPIFDGANQDDNVSHMDLSYSRINVEAALKALPTWMAVYGPQYATPAGIPNPPESNTAPASPSNTSTQSRPLVGNTTVVSTTVLDHALGTLGDTAPATDLGASCNSRHTQGKSAAHHNGHQVTVKTKHAGTDHAPKPTKHRVISQAHHKNGAKPALRTPNASLAVQFSRLGGGRAASPAASLGSGPLVSHQTVTRRSSK
jgi:subtilisin family serine protease